MLRSGIERYLHYHYVGAPWNILDDLFIKRREANWKEGGVANRIYQLEGGVGNGGFSLRDVKFVLHFLSQIDEDHKSTGNEDVLLTDALAADTSVVLCNRSEAHSFSVEAVCPDLARLPCNPLGVHKVWSHQPNDVAMALISRSLPREAVGGSNMLGLTC